MEGLYAAILSDLSAWQVAFLLLAALATSVFHTLSGFAGGVLLSIVVAPVIGVEAVVPALAVALTISATSRIFAFRRFIDFGILANIMIPALPGIVFGAAVYSILPAWLISIILGGFLLLVVAIRRPLQKGGKRVGVVGLGAAGAVFGILSGITIGGGMLLAPFLLGRGLFKERLAALFAAVGFLLNVTKSSVFLATSALDQHLVFLGIAIGACTIPGTYVGMAILRRTSVRIHTGFVEALVAFAGLAFLWAGFTGSP